MESEEATLAQLRKWQSHKFRPTDVSLIAAAQAARTGKNELVYPAPADPGRWILRNKETNEPAIFTFAVLWSYNGNLRTGSYVPPNEDVPKETFLKTMKREPSFKCDITYGFDVTIDKAIYKCMQALEDSVQKKGNFNISKKPRAEYQSAPADNVMVYQIKHRLFSTCNPSEYRALSQEDYPDIHPWLLDAVARSKDKRLMLNLPLPSHLEYRGGTEMALLTDSLPPTFSKGDIVVVTFRLGFYVGNRNWSPEIMPEEFIRVRKAFSQFEGAYTRMNWPKADVRQRLGPGQILPPITDTEMASPEDDKGPNEADSRSEKSLSSSAESVASLQRHLSSTSLRNQHSAESIKRRLAEAMDVEGELISKDELDGIPSHEITHTRGGKPERARRGGHKKPM